MDERIKQAMIEGVRQKVAKAIEFAVNSASVTGENGEVCLPNQKLDEYIDRQIADVLHKAEYVLSRIEALDKK